MANDKILILVNHDVTIYNFRKELVERLLNNNYDVYISSPYGERIDDLIKMGCNYIETKIDRHGTNIKDEIKLLFHYKKIIQRVNPKVVLSYTIKPNIYGGIACRFLNTPFIGTVTGLGMALERENIMQKFLLFLYKIAFKKSNRAFFQNKENQNFFKENNIATEKHRLIPGSGVNLNQFHLLDYPDDETINFLMISRIMKEKGIEQYLKAAEHFNDKSIKFHLCGFCEDEYEDKLEKFENEGIIKYHGMVRDVRKYISKAHCVIHPTYYPEGLSNVLLESAASGRPLITTNRSGCREVVDDGRNGFLIKEKDSDDLIAKINKFLSLTNSERKQMGLAGRKKVENEFDREIVVDAYMEEIERIINKT